MGSVSVECRSAPISHNRNGLLDSAFYLSRERPVTILGLLPMGVANR
jgi:hypothetical protein